MNLHLRDQALQAEDESAVDRCRIVDAILVADEGGAEGAQVEEVIPVSAVAGQAGDVVGVDDACLFLIDQGHDLLKPAAAFGRPGGAAEVAVDDPDLVGGPAGSEGALSEIILES